MLFILYLVLNFECLAFIYLLLKDMEERMEVNK